jgi:hypothetical protein
MLELGDLNEQIIIARLIKQNHVVHLFLLLSLAPLLLSPQIPGNGKTKKEQIRTTWE